VLSFLAPNVFHLAAEEANAKNSTEDEAISSTLSEWGSYRADALLAAEVTDFPGRLGIVHRDLPEMVARGYADVALTQYHLISYWTRIFPDRFELLPVAGAEQYFVNIATGRLIDPLRPRALKAFEEFFFSRARDVYPRYDFARMNEGEYGAILELG